MAEGEDRIASMSVFDPHCISRTVLEHATGRWGALTLSALTGGPLRFAQLGRAVGGVSDRMLSQTLQRLEADGLVARSVHARANSHVDYSLTDLGAPVADALHALIEAIYRQVPGIVLHQQQTPAGGTEPPAD